MAPEHGKGLVDTPPFPPSMRGSLRRTGGRVLSVALRDHRRRLGLKARQRRPLAVRGYQVSSPIQFDNLACAIGSGIIPSTAGAFCVQRQSVWLSRPPRTQRWGPPSGSNLARGQATMSASASIGFPDLSRASALDGQRNCGVRCGAGLERGSPMTENFRGTTSLRIPRVRVDLHGFSERGLENRPGHRVKQRSIYAGFE